MPTVTDAFGDEVLARTETYLDQVRAATAHLPDAVDAYGTDRDAFEAAVDRLSTQESECDATLRELRTLVGESLPPNYTDVYLRADDVMRLYDCVDAVPNHAESFVRELAAMRPDLPERVHEALAEMASLATEATVVLTDVTEAYVESLLAAGEPVRVVDSVDTLATMEGDCDAHKYDALTAAFGACSTADALVVRELLLALDDAVDAIEDAGDHLLSMSSTTL
ncbi:MULTISPECIES: DUF47 family protein [Salinibaculum]|uniref:DUF47 family protein n=1 Tax=Salinibaculum TaxID=2732368 RepID=UPI0030D2B92A